MSSPYTPPGSSAAVLDPITAPAADFRPGTLGDRLAAALIDVVVVGLLWLPVVFLLDLLVNSDLVPFLALLVVAVAYGTAMESSPWQATLGLKVNKLRVVREDGSTLGWAQALIRSILRVALGGVFISWLVPAVTRRKRALWDYPAGAHVIGPKRSAGLEAAIAGAAREEPID